MIWLSAMKGWNKENANLKSIQFNLESDKTELEKERSDLK